MTLVDADLQHLGMIQAFVGAAESAPNGHVGRFGGVVTAVTGSTMSFFNQIVVESAEATVADYRAAIDAMQSSGLGFAAHLRTGDDDRFVAAAEASPLMRLSIPPTPGMVLGPIPDHDPPARLEIRTGLDVFEDHLDVVAAGFELSRRVIESFMTPEFVARDTVQLFVGYDNDRAVSTSFGMTYGRTVNIFNVATLPDHRGRGYGAALTMAAAIAGRTAGRDRACLQSSPMGRPVYERLGFRTVVQYTEWSSPPPG